MRTVKEMRDVADAIFQDAKNLKHLDLACKAGMTDWNQFDARGKMMATLFFEPSTRTRLSFESAMKRLGGDVITANDESSSLMKGETMEDTLKTVSCFADLLVVRSPEPEASWGSPGCPVINAGDGGNSHPTQALLDAFTIWEQKGQKSLTIGVVGDLKHSRTIKSLVEYMSSGATEFIAFDSTGQGNKLGPNPGFYDNVSQRCHTRNDLKEFEVFMPRFDVLYLNRVQNERHDKAVGWSTFILDRKYLNNLRPDCLILNPGPRQEEMPHLNDDRIKMWEQVENGFYVRMALLRNLLKGLKHA